MAIKQWLFQNVLSFLRQIIMLCQFLLSVVSLFIAILLLNLFFILSFTSLYWFLWQFLLYVFFQSLFLTFLILQYEDKVSFGESFSLILEIYPQNLSFSVPFGCLEFLDSSSEFFFWPFPGFLCRLLFWISWIHSRNEFIHFMNSWMKWIHSFSVSFFFLSVHYFLDVYFIISSSYKIL